MLIKRYKEEDGYKGARIGAYLYLSESGLDASAALEKLAQGAYAPDFVVIRETKSKGKVPMLKTIAKEAKGERKIKGEKEISDFLYALDAKKSKSRELLRRDIN
ncbi:MAG: hypothetical protein ACP5UC_02575 [Candidatus Micrarchaeia archaeon]